MSYTGNFHHWSYWGRGRRQQGCKSRRAQARGRNIQALPALFEDSADCMLKGEKMSIEILMQNDVINLYDNFVRKIGNEYV